MSYISVYDVYTTWTSQKNFLQAVSRTRGASKLTLYLHIHIHLFLYSYQQSVFSTSFTLLFIFCPPYHLRHSLMRYLLVFIGCYSQLSVVRKVTLGSYTYFQERIRTTSGSYFVSKFGWQRDGRMIIIRLFYWTGCRTSLVRIIGS